MAVPAPAQNVGEQPSQSIPAPQSGDSEVDASREEAVAQPEEDEAQRALNEAAAEEAREKLRREKEARAQALTLEIVGDLPFAEVKPPENILFVCKLNPVTEGEDLETIFSRFGSIVSCEVIKDKRTGDSLQYAFIEFENQKDCEQAYFKMQGVLIDDHRIHVDFSQSVSKLSDKWRTVTNNKRAKQGGGFGGVANLEKKRQYRVMDRSEVKGRRGGQDMVFEKDDFREERADHRNGRDRHEHRAPRHRSRSRSRSPKSSYRRDRSPRHDSRRRHDHGDRRRRDEHEHRARQR